MNERKSEGMKPYELNYSYGGNKNNDDDDEDADDDGGGWQLVLVLLYSKNLNHYRHQFHYYEF